MKLTLLFAVLLAGLALCSADALSAPEEDQDVAYPVVEELDLADGDLEGAESRYYGRYYRPRYVRRYYKPRYYKPRYYKPRYHW